MSKKMELEDENINELLTLTEIENENINDDSLNLSSNKPVNYIIAPQKEEYKISRKNIEYIGNFDTFKFPENPEIYQIKNYENKINDNGQLLNINYDTIEFKPLKLLFVKNSESILGNIQMNDITSDEYLSSVLFTIKDNINKNYFYILFKILCHVPYILYDMFGKIGKNYLKLEKNIRGQVDGKFIGENSNYDIQITSIDFTNCIIRGIRNNIDTRTYVYFHLKIFNIFDKIYIFTNLYNEETIMENQGIKPIKLTEEKIPDYEELSFDSKGSKRCDYLTKFNDAFEDILGKKDDIISNIIFKKETEIIMEIKFIITIPKIFNENITKEIEKKYLTKEESVIFYTFMIYDLQKDLDMPNISESSTSFGTINFF